MKLSNVALTMFLSSWFLMGCGTENNNFSISGNQENMGNGSGTSNNPESPNDGIAYWRTMQARLEGLASLGIPTEFHVYQGLSHGFGLGTGTVAEGWIKDAVKFWEKQM